MVLDFPKFLLSFASPQGSLAVLSPTMHRWRREELIPPRRSQCVGDVSRDHRVGKEERRRRRVGENSLEGDILHQTLVDA